MPDVLPCPFCGKSPDVRQALNNKEVWGVFCINFDEETGCDICPATKWYLPIDEKDGRTRAVEAWNKRA